MINLTREEIDALHCRYGSRQEFYKLECLDFYGIKRFDLRLIDGSVSLNSDNNVQRSSILTFRHDERIDYINDKCKVYMGIKVQGTLKWYSLGVFLFLKPKIINGICTCKCFDETMYVQQDKIQDPKLFIAGTNYTEVLSYFLITCGITKINIQPTDLVLSADIVCDCTKDKLAWFNYFAEQINYTKLATDENGWFVSSQYVEPNPLNVSNVYRNDQMSVLIGSSGIEMNYWQIPNVFIRIVSNPQLGELVSVYENNDPSSKFSIISRKGRRITDISTIDNVANQIELDNIVRKVAFNSVQVEQEVQFETLNMPTHNSNDILDLKHNDLRGIFVEQCWTIQLKAGARMNHVAKRLVRLE